MADLRTIAAHCDGVRCDMAMLQLNDIFAKQWGRFLKNASAPKTEFWSAAREAAPDLILLAEAYSGTEQRLLDLGFSFAYDKGFYDAVRDARAEDVQARLAADVTLQSRFARFLENHDEARCAAVFGAQRLPGAAALMGTVPGMRFYDRGELEGRTVFLPITLRIQGAAPPDREISTLFAKLLAVTKDEVFHSGGVEPASRGGRGRRQRRKSRGVRMAVENVVESDCREPYRERGAGTRADGRAGFGGGAVRFLRSAERRAVRALGSGTARYGAFHPARGISGARLRRFHEANFSGELAARRFGDPVFFARSAMRHGEGHDLEAGVDVEDVAGDAAAEVAAEEHGGVGDFVDVCVAAQRGVGRDEIQHF